jgi:hypothetical protein
MIPLPLFQWRATRGKKEFMSTGDAAPGLKNFSKNF